jgi:predicted dehydrogenase
MSQGEIRAGLIGYGLGGAVFHAPLLSAAAGVTLAAIVTSDAGRAASASARYAHTRVVPSTDDLWAMADDLDLVVISAVNRAHVPLALAAFDAGLPAVMDKPVAASSVDGQRPVESQRGAYPAFYAGVVEALRTGGPPPVDPRDSVTGLEVIEAAMRSAETGEVVWIEWTDA